jgi:hypothetical protein
MSVKKFILKHPLVNQEEVEGRGRDFKDEWQMKETPDGFW